MQPVADGRTGISNEPSITESGATNLHQPLKVKPGGKAYPLTLHAEQHCVELTKMADMAKEASPPELKPESCDRQPF